MADWQFAYLNHVELHETAVAYRTLEVRFQHIAYLVLYSLPTAWHEITQIEAYRTFDIVAAVLH